MLCKLDSVASHNTAFASCVNLASGPTRCLIFTSVLCTSDDELVAGRSCQPVCLPVCMQVASYSKAESHACGLSKLDDDLPLMAY